MRPHCAVDVGVVCLSAFVSVSLDVRVLVFQPERACVTDCW